MTIVICDSSILILISKVEILDLLIEIFGEILIPQAVYIESVEQGKKFKKMDAFLIEKRIDEGKIVVIEIKDFSEKHKLIEDFNIHEGEAESILLYSEVNANLLGTDDYQTIKICKILKINYFTTPLFIFRCFANKLLSKGKSLQKYDNLSKLGWYKEDLILYYKNKILNSEV